MRESALFRCRKGRRPPRTRTQSRYVIYDTGSEDVIAVCMEEWGSTIFFSTFHEEILLT